MNGKGSHGRAVLYYLTSVAILIYADFIVETQGFVRLEWVMVAMTFLLMGFVHGFFAEKK